MSALGKLIESLERNYPDCSNITVVAMSGRGRDLIHFEIHRQLGGLMPKVQTYDDYKIRRISEEQGKAPITPEEALLGFQALMQRKRSQPVPFEDAARLLHFLALIARFSVQLDEFERLDRYPDEQVMRLKGFFDIMQEFRAELGRNGKFHPPFEEDIFAALMPRRDDLFVGLPLMTPVNEQFFRNIMPEHCFVDGPLFGPHFPPETPDYETALSLVRRLNLPEQRAGLHKLEFYELPGRDALAALIIREIHSFLQERENEAEQLLIVPLDETLSFYLWEMLFRPMGSLVNFSIWLPLRHFGAAQRLLEDMQTGVPLEDTRRAIVGKLATRWHQLDEAN
ncbi:MAG: hypothetical protein LC725_05805, partial [Lentisphaerae bacterium]|nr:hypothetical protein [Lentisphaerota bacterium]